MKPKLNSLVFMYMGRLCKNYSTNVGILYVINVLFEYFLYLKFKIIKLSRFEDKIIFPKTILSLINHRIAVHSCAH